MNKELLPPGSELRIWKGREFRVSTLYSVAGISTTIFVDTNSGRLLLDCGDGTLRDSIELLRKDMEAPGGMQEVDLKEAAEHAKAVLITHPHYDHYSGLLSVLNFMQLLCREAPLIVVYPEGSGAVEDMIDHFTDHLWEEPLFDVVPIPLKDGSELGLDGNTVKAISVEHRNSRPGKVGDLLPSLAYRLERNGEVIAFSGDTGDPGGLEDVFRGADLAIVEATFNHSVPDGRGVHLSVDQALAAAGVARERMLVHFTGGSWRELKNRQPL